MKNIHHAIRFEAARERENVTEATKDILFFSSLLFIHQSNEKK
jgi:hypothetical protein